MVHWLHQLGIFYLNQIADQENTTIWSHSWKSVDQIGLELPFSNDWTCYIQSLHIVHVHILDKEDDLI
jgi:hypothetical protein